MIGRRHHPLPHEVQDDEPLTFAPQLGHIQTLILAGSGFQARLARQCAPRDAPGL